MKAKDIREKSAEDLAELEKSLTREAFQSRFKNFTNRLDDTSSLKKARRDIARVKTILAERANIGEATASQSKLGEPKPAPKKAVAAPKADAAAKPKKTKASKAAHASEASK
jgi:large subunit ribosomal protein L29